MENVLATLQQPLSVATDRETDSHNKPKADHDQKWLQDPGVQSMFALWYRLIDLTNIPQGECNMTYNKPKREK